jgi:hypothetical protein
MGPIKNQRRTFSKLRYHITNEEDPLYEIFCQSWKEVSDECGIPRTALYQILNGKILPRHSKWNISRISLDRINSICGAPHPG